jgi:hypothetical protein
MFVFAVAQVLLAFAPLAEGKTANLRAHVEEAGTTGHHAHDEANCVACVARAMLSSSELPAAREYDAFVTGSSRFQAGFSGQSSYYAGHIQPRAPPLSFT